MSHVSGYEKKDVSVKGLIWGTALLVIVVAIMVVGIRGYYVVNMEKERMQTAINSEYSELNAIIEKDTKILTGYSVVDKEKGIYSIPIEQAMKMVVKNHPQK